MSHSAGHLHSPHGSPGRAGRWPRWRQAAGLLVAVLALHAWLLAAWLAAPAPLPGRPGQPVVRPAAVQVVTRLVGAVPPAAPPHMTAVTAATTHIHQPRVVANPAANPVISPDAAPAADPALALPAAPSPAAPLPPAPPPPPNGEQPPTYATRPPPSTTLHYQLRYGNAPAAQASLDWQNDGQHYSLHLAGGAPGQPLLEQRSDGSFDTAGLAPQRYTDRRRGRAWRAANFERQGGGAQGGAQGAADSGADAGADGGAGVARTPARITFSASTRSHPAWAGAQDRLAWLVQLTAVARAAGDDWQPGRAITLFVVDAWGAGDAWTFVLQGLQPAALPTTPGGPPGPAWYLLREPRDAEDQRVEVWLDPARGLWPARVRYTLLRSNNVTELQMDQEPQTSPP